MRIELSVRPARGEERAIEVCAEPGTALAAALPHIQRILPSCQGWPSDSTGAPLPRDAALGNPPLQAGNRIRFDKPVSREISVPLTLRLHVAGGPHAGMVLPVQRDLLAIGRGEDAHLRLDDPRISRRHAEIQAGTAGVLVRDVGSTNGTYLEGTRLSTDFVPFPRDSYLTLGATTLSIEMASDLKASSHAGVDGTTHVQRRTCPPAALERRSIEFPKSVVPSTQLSVPVLVLVIPVIGTIVMAAAFRNLQFLAFAAIGTFGLLAATVAERRHRRRRKRDELSKHAAAEAVAKAALDEACLRETRMRRLRHPDPVEVLDAAAPGYRIWERDLVDELFLTVRVGLADRPADSSGRHEDRPPEHPVLFRVPVCVDLKNGPVAISGSDESVDGLVRWFTGQILGLHSPLAVTLRLILSKPGLGRWEWVKWVLQAGHRVALTSAEHEAHLAELEALVRSRRSQLRTGERWSGPWIVLIVDDARSFARNPTLHSVLGEGRLVGVATLILSEWASDVPRDCRSVITLAPDHATPAQITMHESNETVELNGVLPDHVTRDWAEELTRRLAPLRDADLSSTSNLPDKVGLLQLLNIQTNPRDGVLKAWGARQFPATCLGMGADGVVVIDLVADGPHFLVAGSTGSGKSELLRSLIVGLAARVAPDRLNFVLIDYKGGAAFAECAELPHSTGMMTDLDSTGTVRALASLDAEIRKREAAFLATGVTDIADYQTTPQQETCPLARLVIVIDEFATLSDELPNFIPGLVAVAQRGRSLGIHLVLATQRPAGVVSPEIKANVSTRICLRVTDAGESHDVIGTAAAATISKSRPGRGYARLAHGIIEFQAAISSASHGDRASLSVRLLDEWNRAQRSPTDSPVEGPTDLAVLSRAIDEAADAWLPTIPSPPWLPPLPTVISAGQIRAGNPEIRSDDIVIGLCDDPRSQRQLPVLQPMFSGGAIAFAGGPGSGRTTALLGIIGQVFARLGPSHAHCYLFDFAGSGLGELEDLPHCGAVVHPGAPYLLSKATARLSEELDRRMNAPNIDLGKVSTADQERPPTIVVAVDGWESLVSCSEANDLGRSAETLLRLMRDGTSVSMLVVITGERALVSPAVAAVTTQQFLLRPRDASDYVLASLDRRAASTTMCPGRAIGTSDGLEIQCVTLAGQVGVDSQLRLVRTAAQVDRMNGRIVPIPLRALPKRVELAQVLGQARAGHEASYLVIGPSVEAARPVGINLTAEHPHFVVAGAARSGRTTTLVTLARQWASTGQATFILAPRRSDLFGWAASAGVVHAGIEDAQTISAVRAFLNNEGRRLIVIDNLERIEDGPLADAVAGQLGDRTLFVIAASRAEDLAVRFHGLGATLRRSGAGILLRPARDDGDLLGVRVPLYARDTPAGRGLLVTDALREIDPDGTLVQVAYSEVTPGDTNQ